ncbi:peptidoglycan D,D-transpeptidase FtsI family protein [Armatimonas rosea]|uniref:Cell division protein FtsI/penicillin-binding protein 2 n=1 Tax=Armatimonas rosea TaxID=685828 RepID=A0A7W9SN94_ARMRO|nr:penicillin-binding protein 2 [Armatimonas rosea]MBB6049731.1 cell division protein FtsI/penicillin-binding protein 2 [Armatimonas rosea]
MAVRRAHRFRRETPEEFEGRTGPRLLEVGLVLGAVHLLLLGRLAYVQLIRHDELKKESLTRWRAPRTLTPTRGMIYDRNGALLVQNEPGFSVVVNPNRWCVHNSTNPKAHDSREERRAHVLRVLGSSLSPEDLAWIQGLDLSAYNPDHPFATRQVAEWISPETVEKLRQTTVNLAPPIPDDIKKKKGALAQPRAELPGVSYPPATRRRALNGTLAAHVLGFTESTGERAWRGVELSQNAILAGQPGKVTYEFDKLGMIQGTEQVRQKLVQGSHLYLTLDAELQHDAEQALGKALKQHRAEAGAVIVLDAHNGDVLAMASAPLYNTNAARTPVPGTKIDLKPRINWALERIYEPGSTLKAMTIAAALEEHEVTPETTFFCKGERKLGKDTIHCAAHGEFQHGHGTQNLKGVLSHSCNVATAEYGMRLGPQKLHRYLQDFGVGERTKVGLPAEEKGVLHDPAKKAWQPIDVATISFGQGVTLTPLQLAAAYTVFVDGRYHAPRLVAGVRSPETGLLQPRAVVPGRRVLSEETAAQMREMLGGVIDIGTGQPAQLDGYSAGGKTGTAQMAKDKSRGYSKRFVASFVGLAPLKDPQFVILTMIRDPKGPEHFGGSVAGPIFKEIAERALLLRRTPNDRPFASKDKDKKRKVSTAEA